MTEFYLQRLELCTRINTQRINYISHSFIFLTIIFYHFIIHVYCSFFRGALCRLFNKRILDWIGLDWPIFRILRENINPLWAD